VTWNKGARLIGVYKLSRRKRSVEGLPKARIRDWRFGADWVLLQALSTNPYADLGGEEVVIVWELASPIYSLAPVFIPTSLLIDVLSAADVRLRLCAD